MNFRPALALTEHFRYFCHTGKLSLERKNRCSAATTKNMTLTIVKGESTLLKKRTVDRGKKDRFRRLADF